MKRTLGTFVLFALLLLTVVALTKVDAPQANALSTGSEAQTAN